MPNILTTPTGAYPSIPDAGDTLESHTLALQAIRDSLETGERQDGNYLESFITFQELVDLGIIDNRGEFILSLGDVGFGVLNAVTDVTITGTPANDEVLAYDTASGEWINQTAAEAGLVSASHTHLEEDITDLQPYLLNISGQLLGNLNNVTLADPPLDKEFLVFDLATGDWINQTSTELGITGTDPGTTIDAVLRWDGSDWAEETGVLISDVGVLTIGGVVAATLDTNWAAGDITSGVLAADRVATHTGDVTGQTALTFAVVAITGKTALTSGLSGTDELVLSDDGVIKRMDISVMNAYFDANLSFVTSIPAHTGQVTGQTALSLAAAAITDQTVLSSGLASGDDMLVVDAGVLKQMNVSVMTSFFNANLTAFSLTAHTHTGATISDLDAGDTTTGIFATAQIPDLAASKIISGVFAADRVPTHTGQVTGQTVLSLAAAAITGQTVLASGLDSGDDLLVVDAGVLKQMNVSVMTSFFNANLTAFSLTAHTHTGSTISALDAGDTTTGTFGEARIPSLPASRITSGTFAADRVPTHTGQVTGQTALSLAAAAITDQTALTTGLASGDDLLVSDAGVLKQMNVSVIESYMNANLNFAAASHSHNLGGDFTGTTASGALAATAISGESLVTAITGDMVLLWDATDSALKRANVSDFLGSGGVDWEVTGAEQLHEDRFDNVILGQLVLASGLASGDDMLVSDAGVLKQMNVSVMTSFFNANLTAFSLTAHTHTGSTISALDAGDTTTGTFPDARIASAATWNAKAPLADPNFTGFASFGGDTIGGLQSVTGNYGSVQVTGNEGSSGGWRGYSIAGEWVFMSSGAAQAGIYNDTDNEWAMFFDQNAQVRIYYNGIEKFTTAATGINVFGTVLGNAYGTAALPTFRGNIASASGFYTESSNVLAMSTAGVRRLQLYASVANFAVPLRTTAAPFGKTVGFSDLGGAFLNMDGKEVIDADDTWLRLNQNSDFSSGIHVPGFMQVGSFRVVGNLTVDATGDITKTSHGNYLYHQSTVYDDDQEGGITFSTGAATGGADGDIWFRYT